MINKRCYKDNGALVASDTQSRGNGFPEDLSMPSHATTCAWSRKSVNLESASLHDAMIERCNDVSVKCYNTRPDSSLSLNVQRQLTKQASDYYLSQDMPDKRGTIECNDTCLKRPESIRPMCPYGASFLPDDDGSFPCLPMPRNDPIYSEHQGFKEDSLSPSKQSVSLQCFQNSRNNRFENRNSYKEETGPKSYHSTSYSNGKASLLHDCIDGALVPQNDVVRAAGGIATNSDPPELHAFQNDETMCKNDKLRHSSDVESLGIRINTQSNPDDHNSSNIDIHASVREVIVGQPMAGNHYDGNDSLRDNSFDINLRY